MAYQLKINGNNVKEVNIAQNSSMERVKEIKDGEGTTLWEAPTPISSPFRVNNAFSGNNTCTLTKNGSAPDINMKYSMDNTNWSVWTPDANGVRTVTIPQDGRLYLKGDNPDGLNTVVNDTDYYSITCSQNYSLAGNVNSLFSEYETDTVPNYCFNNLFKDSTTLNRADYLRLPATVVGENAYHQMFKGCTGLTRAPHELPAVDAVSNVNTDGYYAEGMFYGCTSLTTMPIIRMTRFGKRSCYEMFRDCSALVNQWTSTEPSVTTTGNISFSFDADNGQDRSLYGMFRDCTSLTDASNVYLNVTSIKDYCYHQMFHGCSALTTPPTITSSALTVGDRGLQQMFNGCSALTTAPNLNISTLDPSGTRHCYNIFSDCSALNDVTKVKLNATTLYVQSYRGMFSNCTSLVTPPEIKATTLTYTSGSAYTGSLSDMFYNCSKISTIKVHFTDWGGGNSTQRWTYGTKSSGTFYKPSSLPSTKNTSGNTSYAHYIPYNWTVTTI